MVFGPVGQANYTQQEKRDYAFVLGISSMEFDQILSVMHQLLYNRNFLHFLLLLNFYFNGERKDICEIVACLQIDDNSTIYSKPSKKAVFQAQKNKDEMPKYFTRSFEKEMLNFVREGDVSGLKNFFSSTIYSNIGTLSQNQIRQQKNLFIVATTLISRAAIDGGMYEDQAYQLSDMYIRRCEELFSMEAIMKLSYKMALDFTQQVFSWQSNMLSPLVASVITISARISADLSSKRYQPAFY